MTATRLTATRPIFEDPAPVPPDAAPPDAPACPFCRQRDLFLADEPSQADDRRLFAVICRTCWAHGPRAYAAPDAWRLWKERIDAVSERKNK